MIFPISTSITNLSRLFSAGLFLIQPQGRFHGTHARGQSRLCFAAQCHINTSSGFLNRVCVLGPFKLVRTKQADFVVAAVDGDLGAGMRSSFVVFSLIMTPSTLSGPKMTMMVFAVSVGCGVDSPSQAFGNVVHDSPTRSRGSVQDHRVRLR